MINGNSEVRRYLRNVQSWLPGTRKIKNGIISQIEKTVINYLAENPSADFDSLVKRFGTPQQIASAYVDELDTAELLYSLRIKRKIVSIVAAFAAAVILLWVGVISYAYLDYQNSAYGYYKDRIIDVVYIDGMEGE